MIIKAIKLGKIKDFREWISDINIVRAYNLIRDYTVGIQIRWCICVTRTKKRETISKWQEKATTYLGLGREKPVLV